MTTTETSVSMIASAHSWIEGESVRQLYAAAKLEGVRRAIGFPDLHPGKGGPVGAAFITEDVIHPLLVGGDIGCGMALWRTDLLRHKARLDRWTALPFDLEEPWEGNTRERLASAGLLTTQFAEAFGTLGGGNHFAELQAVEKVTNPMAFSSLGLAKDELVLLVHSGSRGLGRSVLETHIEEHGGAGVDATSSAATRYLLCQDHAVRWAEASRALLAQRFLDTLGATGECIWDGCHNSITRVSSPSPLNGENITPVVSPSPLGGERAGVRGESGFDHLSEPVSLWLHRKGAAPSDGGALVIPGSRGTFSYLVQPCGDGASHAWSLAHGAGRKWTRSDSRARVRERFRPAQLVQTGLGGRVVCADRSLLYEEAPPAYKNIEQVIEDLLDAGLITVIATLRPLLTYKMRAIWP
ncbi:MAG TPA: RNA ligase RtcB family protein [Verrucomicrobiae bacterium]|nr:RNA ligase RtcB family protein [Verrucomicrobiae bacterium]